MADPDHALERDARELQAVDIATVDSLCRMALGARRLGRRLYVRNAAPELRALLDLTGLTDVVPCGPGLRRRAAGVGRTGGRDGRCRGRT